MQHKHIVVQLVQEQQARKGGEWRVRRRSEMTMSRYYHLACSSTCQPSPSSWLVSVGGGSSARARLCLSCSRLPCNWSNWMIRSGRSSTLRSSSCIGACHGPAIVMAQLSLRARAMWRMPPRLPLTGRPICFSLRFAGWSNGAIGISARGTWPHCTANRRRSSGSGGRSTERPGKRSTSSTKRIYRRDSRVVRSRWHKPRTCRLRTLTQPVQNTQKLVVVPHWLDYVQESHIVLSSFGTLAPCAVLLQIFRDRVCNIFTFCRFFFRTFSFQKASNIAPADAARSAAPRVGCTHRTHPLSAPSPRERRR